MTLDGDSGLAAGAPDDAGITAPMAHAEALSDPKDNTAAASEMDGKAPIAEPVHGRVGGRAKYLAEVSLQLWPHPAHVSISGADESPAGDATEAAGPVGGARGDGRAAKPAGLQTVSEFVVLPGVRRPRLLVPVARRPAATALRRYGKPSSLKTRLGTQGLSLVFRTGLGTAMLRDRLLVQAPAGTPTIESYLGEALGLDVTVSLYLGSARANRKPVLQLLTRRGDTFGYAKVGVNELTKTLVRVERDALTRLGHTKMETLTVPRMLHYGAWQDLTVLVLSPLPVWLRHSPLPSGHLERAMREVAGLDGISRAPLVTSAYWQRLGRLLSTADKNDDRSTLLDALGGIAERAGGATLSFGACHGDWSPWNMAKTSNGLLVWDWERFSTGVPLGFDALHHWLQGKLQASRPDPRAAAAECVNRAISLLAPLEVEAGEAAITASMYLADLATRYLVDRQAEAGARFGRPGRWLIPALNTSVARL
jgi:hypothetical protein